MTLRRGLGKGLDALIPAGEATAGAQTAPIASIRPNPRQPRTRFDPDELEQLAASIREHGVLQPLLVSLDTEPGRYVLIAGERRLEASKRAGLTRVPILVRDASDQQRLEIALIENVQRADLGPLETAEAFRQLSEEFGLSHDEIARRVGKQRTTVTNTLRLLKLPPNVQAALADARLTEGHARALLSLPHAQAQAAAAQTVIRKDLNVRQTEELVRRMVGAKAPRGPVRQAAKSADLKALENRLRDALGTKVLLSHGRKGGTITISFYSDEELNAIAETILAKH